MTKSQTPYPITGGALAFMTLETKKKSEITF